MKPALTIVFVALALVANGRQSLAATEKILSEELLLSIFDGERSNAGRAEKLLQAATSLGSDKKTQIALLKEAIEYGFKSLATPKGRTATEESLDRLIAITEMDAEDSFPTDKRIEFYRTCYQQYAKKRHEKLDIRSKLIASLSQGAQHFERAQKCTDAIKIYTEVIRLSTRPASPDLARFRRKLKRAIHMRKVQQQIDLASKQLKGNTYNVKTRTALIKMFLVEYDDPAQAARYLNDDVDEILRTYIPMAIIQPFEVKLSVCKEMAKWYGKVLTKDASIFAKPNMLRRGIV